MSLQWKNKYWDFYVISWMIWDDNDLSKNMISKIMICDIIFVEEINHFNFFIKRLWLEYKWEIIEMWDDLSYLNNSKSKIIEALLSWKNIWLFESWWTACFRDPWFELVDYIYSIRKRLGINIYPIPWSWAVQTAISVSWFDMDKYVFLDWININTKNEIEKYNFPVIYFNHIEKFNEFEKNINFMKNIDERKCFVWVNLWKFWVKYSNLLIRWKLSEVYDELVLTFKDSEIPDLVFIFDKKW